MQLFILELQNNQWLFYSLVTLISLSVGSFLNVVIYRLPKILQKEWSKDCKDFLELKADKVEEFSLSKPNITCPECGHAIRVWENIPVISYLILRGKCSSCKTSISIQYILLK